jgi:UPF0755 protein
MANQSTNNPRHLTGYSYLLAGGTLLLAAAGCLVVLLITSTPLMLNQPEAIFEVQQGSGLSTVVNQIEDKGWVSSGIWLKLFARATSYRGQIKAGEYRVTADMTQRMVIDLFRSGQVMKRHFTIIEGWTLANILQHLSDTPALQHELDQLTEAEILTLIDREHKAGEGYFFPDTYQYTKGATDLSVLQQSYNRMRKILEREWSNPGRNQFYSSAHDVLVMASIIEKETAREEDRARISAVFLRRLEQNMRLQSDPTVIYGMGTRFRGNLSRGDLRTASPFNTYLNKGLPPTPICSPGLASIKAALYPADISSLYFVSRGDGSSEFSDTLAEHNRAVQKYQIKRGTRTASGSISNRQEESIEK